MTRVVPIRPAPYMPPEAPLAMEPQDLGTGFNDALAPGCEIDRSTKLWRWMTFGSCLVLTLTVVALFTDFFRMGGVSPFEGILIGLIAFSFFWIALAVSTALTGLANGMTRKRPDRRTAAPMTVALLVPMHNENPVNVMGNAWAMMDDLSRQGPAHRFSLFLLSDTKDAELAAREERVFADLRLARPDAAFHYRWFPENTQRKIGNLSQWIQTWGGAYEAMIVLDADSLMSAETINALTDALAADPSAGLIQSTPRLHGTQTLFGRVQQFGNAVYGGLLGAGLAAWSGVEGNYWGHNAIIRVRAFAASAGLPRLGRKGTLILSHDFVEAALLRRAGWGVRVIPNLPGTYEEAPGNIIDFVLRDRRWCRGNLQHLRLLAVPGLRPASRFHLFQGAMSYLVSPVWLVLLFVWAAIGVGEERSIVVYFSGLDPRPHWPEVTGPKQLGFLLFMYGMLLAPKIIGAAALPLSGISSRDLGGPLRMGLSMAAEIVLSIAYAPILMVQQTGAVLRGLLGRNGTWTPTRMSERTYGFRDLAKFHCAETLLGLCLSIGIGLGFVTLWLLPIAASLTLAIPLSALSDLRLSGRFKHLLATEDTHNRPGIIAAAHLRRSELAGMRAGAIRHAAE